jgi:hypothetical protein
MQQIEFLSKNVFFTTRQYAFALNVGIETASRQLKKISTEGASLSAITRGIWAQTHHPFFSPSGAVPYLLSNEQGYISFLTALHRHGVISQIPNVIQIATTGHGRKLSTSIGQFEFIKIQPRLMRDGIQVHEGKNSYNVATPEKALLDTLYISTRRGRRFRQFPEIEWSKLRKKKLSGLIAKLAPGIQKLIQPRLLELIS